MLEQTLRNEGPPKGINSEGIRMLEAFWDKQLPEQARRRIGERLIATQPPEVLLQKILDRIYSDIRSDESDKSKLIAQCDYTACELVMQLYRQHSNLQVKIEHEIMCCMNEPAGPRILFTMLNYEVERFPIKMLRLLSERFLDENDPSVQGNLAWALELLVNKFDGDEIGAAALAGNIIQTANRDSARAALLVGMIERNLGRNRHHVEAIEPRSQRQEGVGTTYLNPWKIELRQLLGNSAWLARTASDALTSIEFGQEVVRLLEDQDLEKKILGLYAIVNGSPIVNKDARARAKEIISEMDLEGQIHFYQVWVEAAIKILDGWEDFFGQFRHRRDES